MSTPSDSTFPNPEDTPLWQASDEQHAAWQTSLLKHVVALVRPHPAPEGESALLRVYGTGTLVQPEGWRVPYILTAAHVVPEEEESLYVVIPGGNPLQLSPPAFIDQHRDFAFFAAVDVLTELPSKEVVPLKPWPPSRVERGIKVGVVGYPRDTVVQDAGPMEKMVRLHSYSGTVDDFSNGKFGALTYSNKPYATTIPLADAVGISGGPVFEVIDGCDAVSIRGVHCGSFISGREGRIVTNDLFFAPKTDPTGTGSEGNSDGGSESTSTSLVNSKLVETLRSENDLFVILRVHLIVEHSLNAALLDIIPGSEPLLRKIGFSDRVEIARKLDLFEAPCVRMIWYRLPGKAKLTVGPQGADHDQRFE